MTRLALAIAEPRATSTILAAAALTALAIFAIGAGMLLDGARLRIESAGRLVTIAVAADDPNQQAERAQSIAAMLRRRGDLRDVRIVPERAIRSEIGDGTLPALIDATLLPGAEQAPLAHAMAGLPGVSVARAGAPSTGGLRNRARVARLIAALAFVGIFATGIGSARDRLTAQTIAFELLERLGAADTQLLRLISLGMLRSLLIGGVVGAASSIPFIAWQAGAADAGGVNALPLSSWTMLVSAPIAMILLGGLGATAAAWRGLRARP